MKSVYWILCWINTIVIVFSGCQSERVYITHENQMKIIRKGMEFKKLIAELGEPSKKKGFGREFYVWNLDDEKELVVFVANDSVKDFQIVSRTNEKSVFLKRIRDK